MVDAMLADVPPDAASQNFLLSTLIHEAIPPEFLQLETPDDENVVTKAMALEADVDKHDLLLALGTGIHHEGVTDESVAKYEDALDTLLGFDDPQEATRVIEQRFL